MERIPAASAMKWSIELDKGLRSKHPDEHKSALEKIEPRLQQLSTEPNITKSIAQTYNLIPQEDKLFINTIILRLCNSFKTGNYSTRTLILKIFLQELKQIKNKGRGYKGILSKERVCNKEEILKRVKSVFHTEDKVLALGAFGCMADFAKDSIEIRHLVISSLKSGDISEVKAALFAASCFCLLSKDFSQIFLELLANFITSSSGHADVMVTAVRAFSKIRCTFGVSCTSYKVGKMILASLSDERLRAELLSSLTILASQYTILSSQQVEFLIQFMTPESSNLMKFRALKCLYYLFNQDKSHFNINRDVFSAILVLIENNNLPLRFQILALRILQKIFSTLLPNIPFLETITLYNIIQTLKNASHSSQKQKKLLSIQILVEIVHICFKAQVIPEISLPIYEHEKENKIANYVILIIIDNITSVVEKLSEDLREIDFSEFKSLLGFILQIAKDYPLVTLERVKLLLVQILKKENKNLDLCIIRYLNLSLSLIFEDKGVKLENIYPIVKPLLDSIKENSNDLFCLNINLYSNDQSSREINAIRLSKSIIEKRNYWEAYKIGIYSCCEGLWFNSAFIFKNLVGVLKSNIYNSWLKSLLLLSGSESEIRLILFPKLGLQLVHELSEDFDCSKDEKNMDLDEKNVDLSDFEEKFGTICSRLFSSEENLETNKIFCFQRWFVILRARFIETILDLIKTRNKIETLIRDGNLKMILFGLSKCSTNLIDLVKECDLICTSFFDMDKKSFEIISNFALICSLLSFSMAFFLDFPNFPNILGVKISIIPFLEDLCERLHGIIDNETMTQLLQLMPLNSLVNDLMESRVEKEHFGYLHKDCGSICKFALAGLIQIKGLVNEEDLFPFMNRGLELLLEIVRNCMEMNFRVPKYFFKIRPCIGAEMFIFDSNQENKPEMSISKGSHLSINLCIQLKNIPQNTLPHITKLHCILSTKPSLISHSQDTKRMVELSCTLWQYVSRKGSFVNMEKSEGDSARAFVTFEMNGRGLGFGSCLLDVSKFKEGLYQIKWHSGFVNERGDYCSLLPLNAGVVFSIKKP